MRDRSPVPPERVPALVGTAALAPAGPVPAAAVGTWTVTLRLGAYGVDDGGRILVCRRFASDWGEFQAADPAAPDYVTAESARGDAALRIRWDPKAYIRPWQKAIVVDVVDGSLPPGDEVTVTLGDRRGGSPGTRAQTFCERGFAFRVLVDCFGTGCFAELPVEGRLDIVSGEAARLVCLVPSWLAVGETGWLFLRAVDRWGNPAAGYRGEMRLQAPAALEGLPASVPFRAPDGGAGRVEGLRVGAPGVFRVRAEDPAAGLAAESNPLRVTAEAPRLRPWWGDLHGQSGETIGSGTVEEYFTYARDVANVDFTAHQGNDFQMTAEFWQRLKAVTKRFHAPGRFVTFLGVEWSGVTPAGGDRNVLYREDDGPLHRSSRWQVPDDPEAAGDRYPVSELFASLRGRDDVLTVAHVGGRRADLAFHDPAVEPLVEVHSAWGTFEWLLEDALRRGLRVGFCAGSDDHKCRPGASHPGAGAFGVAGGLTCAWAPALTREALWEALRARRVYGTSGERILLHVTADGHMMGEEYSAGAPPRLAVEVWGTGPLEAVELFRGLDLIHSAALAAPAPDDSPRIRIAWSGARIYQRNRQTVWDGSLELAGGTIRSVEGYAFDTPAEGIVAWDARTVRWTSKTTGDEDGVILELDAPASATLTFHTGLASFTLPLSAITARPYVVDAGGVRQQVALLRLPLHPYPAEASLEFTDEGWQPGWNAYWVRVRQWDGARAWSSPIYVRRSSPSP